MLTYADIQQIRERGSDPELVEMQIERFKAGFPFTELIKPATPLNGILRLSDIQKRELADLYDGNRKNYDICRFVPASGAATRMFRSLFSFREALHDLSVNEQRNFVNSDEQARSFYETIDIYPFWDDLNLEGDESPLEILNLILLEKGLNYGQLPKGLIKFHKYGTQSRTAFEEHLHESARMAGTGEEVELHFTVSEEHLNGFKELEETIGNRLEQQYGMTFRISYSFQKKETDTIAVDMNNNPFRDDQGKLVFRPGGHGALLENLNDLEYDIVFINNIDNVSPDMNSELRVLNKKMLGGLVMQLKKETKKLIRAIQSGEDGAVENAKEWLRDKAFREIPEKLNELNEKQQLDWLIVQLDRPIRACGMVRNEGEPGGGPFFTRNSDGEISLQIVESSQVDTNDIHQAGIFAQSTHFNPVDLACSMKDADGKGYDLMRFVDKNMGFISKKSMKGKDLKALELPGL